MEEEVRQSMSESSILYPCPLVCHQTDGILVELARLIVKFCIHKSIHPMTEPITCLKTREDMVLPRLIQMIFHTSWPIKVKCHLDREVTRLDVPSCAMVEPRYPKICNLWTSADSLSMSHLTRREAILIHPQPRLEMQWLLLTQWALVSQMPPEYWVIRGTSSPWKPCSIVEAHKILLEHSSSDMCSHSILKSFSQFTTESWNLINTSCWI